MARTVKDPDERRRELIASAQKLFYNKGYESTSVSDIVNEAGVAKGTFYYYFDSKQAVLEAMIDDLVAYSVSLIRPIIEDASLTAQEKWIQAFRFIGNWKSNRKSEMIALLGMMMAEENALLRYKTNLKTVDALAGELAKIIGQGVQEGVFNTKFGEDAARIALGSSLTLSTTMYDLLLHPDQYDDPAALAKQNISAVQDAIERILGAEAGSLPLADDAIFDAWFSEKQEPQLENMK
jgi:AcrR family transcriptional regulator